MYLGTQGSRMISENKSLTNKGVKLGGSWVNLPLIRNSVSQKKEAQIFPCIWFFSCWLLPMLKSKKAKSLHMQSI